MKNNPQKYEHDMSDRSKYLGMKYDKNLGILHIYKLQEFDKLKQKYECTGFFDCGCYKCQGE